MKSVWRVCRLYGARNSVTSVEPYMTSRTSPETTAMRWRLNFHHISFHWDAR